MAVKNEELQTKECNPVIEGEELIAWLKENGTPTRVTFVGPVFNCGNYAEGYCALAEARCSSVKRLSIPRED